MGRRVSGVGRMLGGSRSRTTRVKASRVPASDKGLASLRVRDLMVRSLVTVDHDAALGAAEKLLGTGTFKSSTSLDRAELAAWTAVASMILNLDETVTKS